MSLSASRAAHHPYGQLFSVWAPRASQVTLVLEGERLELSRQDDGWWLANRRMRDGAVYAYFLDGEGPFPDPRSAFQPSGVHGPSQCVDHGRFEWTDAGWQPPPLAAGVVYELHVGTFSESGTFEGVVEKLPHLRALGVTHLELMPVCEFSGARGWGYDGVDLFAPHHVYGGPAGLKRLIDACHAHGLAVILDVVYNHLGPAGNYLNKFAPYFTGRYHTPWGDAVNLDGADSDEVRRFFCDNAVMWLRDYHADGLRLDAVHALIDLSARHFLEQLADEIDTLEATVGRHLVLIAESDLNDPRVIRSREAAGYGIDAQWSDDFHHALHAFLTGEQSGYYADFGTLEQLALAFRQVFVYTGGPSIHRRRSHGRRLDDVPGWRFVVAAQNHDQVGNRVAGERLGHLIPIGRLKIAAALLLTSPFVPLLFQGEEWDASTPFHYFTSHEDAELARQVSEGRVREFAAFGWDPSSVPDPQSPDTFERSRLRWDELSSPDHQDLLNWHRDLIALRKRRPELRDGRYREAVVSFHESPAQLSIRRGALLIVANVSSADCTHWLEGRYALLLASRSDIVWNGTGLRLPSDSIAVLESLKESPFGAPPEPVAEMSTREAQTAS